MPIVRLSAEDANRNLRRNRASLWPDGRVPTSRLGDLAKVSFNPSFTFSKSDKILTIGSCFAREMERRLASLGFDLPMTRVVLPREERYTMTADFWIGWAFGVASVGAVWLARRIATAIERVRDAL